MLKKKNRRSGKKSKKKSEFSRFVKFLKTKYGCEWITHGSKQYRAMLLVWSVGGPLPPRMPTPHGPLSGAELSTVQRIDTFTSSTGISSSTIYQTGATEVLGQIAFELADLSQVSTFSSMFDQYRIDRVHLRITPKNNSVFLASIAAPNQSLPTVFVVVDFDDATAPSSVDELRQYSSCQEVGIGAAIDIVLQPSITPAVWSGGAFSGYGVTDSSMWLDIANTGIPHFGVKFGVPGLQASATYSWQWDVGAWYSVSFRSIR
jgi:hypothetical protein